jgi:hypothetical protein
MAQPADVPWWSNLVSILLTAVVSVVGTVYFLRSPPSTPSQIPTIGTFIKDTITYIPHILLLFGVLADMFTMEGVYSIPSLVGLISIPLNWVFKYFWAGVADIISKVMEVVQYKPVSAPTQMGGGPFFDNYDGCTVQGFDWAKSPYAPQTLVVTATVFSYYMFDLIANRGWINATATIVVFGVLYIAEMFIIGSCGTGESTVMNMLTRGVASLTEGLVFGGSSYAIVQAYYPNRLPTSVLSPFPRLTRADLNQNTDGTFTDNDGNPWLVLPNGQAVPDTSSADARRNFAEMAGRNLGTGAPAVPASCKT